MVSIKLFKHSSLVREGQIVLLLWVAIVINLVFYCASECHNNQHNDTKHSDNQHNNIQHCEHIGCLILSAFILSLVTLSVLC